MYIIEAVKGDWKWISGVFMEEQKSHEFFEMIPDDLKPYQRLYEIPHKEYPVYIVEKDGFSFVSKDELIRKLKLTEISDREESVYFNYYYITEDYWPEKPGRDHMGSLYHEHVTNDYLKEFSIKNDLD
ncbi:MAG: hypothetical protein GX236_00695 [Clostridiaceae bacterium]|nr:hypothetical protein [Clostridiaceae bacterium]